MTTALENRDLWQRVYRAFDPRRPLTADEVDAQYVDHPYTASRLICEDLAFDDGHHQTFVVCGSRGSGKSTELSRLQQERHAHNLVVRVDLLSVAPEPVSTTGVILALAVAALRALDAWDAPAKLRSRHHKALRDATTELTGGTEVEFDWAGMLQRSAAFISVTAPASPAGVAAAVVSAVAGATRVAWSSRVGRAAAEASDGTQSRLLMALNGSIAALEESCGRPPLFLADGLDKLTDLDQVVQALATPRLLVDVAAPLVFTGPINLLHSTEFNALRQHVTPLPLYNLPVRDHADPDGAEGDGVRWLREMVQRRVESHALPTSFMPEAVFAHLARNSGGSLRDFADLIRNAARLAKRRDPESSTLDSKDSDGAVREFRHLLQFSLNDERLTQLRRVLELQRPTGDPTCDDLLFNNYILSYPNGDLWYRPHEALVAWIRSGGSADGP